MAKPALKDYSDDPTVSAFETIDDLVAPKPSAMSGIRPDLQPNVVDFSPYSLDPTINAFNPMEAIEQAFSPEPTTAPKQQGNPYVAKALEQMFKLRQGAQATGLSALDLAAGLPAQIAGGLTYGGARLGGVEPERAQQMSEYASTPLSYLQPGKLATMTNQPIGQGTEAYAASPISQLGEVITKYGAQPAIDMLVKQGMAPQDAQQLVTNAPLLVLPGIKLGKMGIQTAKNIPECVRELKTPEAARIEPQMDVNQTPQPPVNANQMPQSVGAAQATPAAVLQGNIDAAIANASPELQAHIRTKPPESINVPALEVRSLEEKHGVNLSTGQRTGDTGLYSQEWNKRGETNILNEHFNEQPKQFKAAFENSIRRNAPDIFETDPSSIGQLQINGLAAKDAKRVTAIDAAYKDFRDRYVQSRQDAGLPIDKDFPVDGNSFLKNTESALKNELLQHDVPPAIKSLLDDIREKNGNMTYNEFINLDKRLSAKTKEGNGSERAAAFVIRKELQNVPLSSEASALQPFYENARGLAKERFDTIKNNPAYRAAINEATDLKELASTGESLKADKFHDKFVNKGSPESIRRMKAELADDPQALQAMTAGELRIAMRKAGLATDTPDLNPKQLANYIYDNKGRLQEALGPEGMKDLMEMAALSSKVGMPKTGTFNYSNTFSSQLAEMAKQGLLTIGEAKLASSTMGASVPAIGLTKQFMQKLNKEGFAKQATNPVGGLTKD